MANQVGKRYSAGKCNSEMIVTKGGDGALSCCGQPMQQKSREPTMPNQLGKRFQCETCGTEVLCIKPGDGASSATASPMQLQQPKVLPSAD